MPLRTACSSCGKKLQVRDELLGKKVKCPACATVFVADADGAPNADKAAPSRPAAPPPAKTSPKPQVKRPAPPAIEDDEEDEDDEVQEKPRRLARSAAKPGRASSRTWMLLALAAVVVLGGAAGAYFMFFSGPPASPSVAKGPPPGPQGAPPAPTPENPAPQVSGSLAELVPGDALAFATVSGELWHAKAFDALRPMFGKTVEDGFQEKLGFPLADLERASVFTVADFAQAKQNKMAPVVILVQSKKPFDQAKVREALKKSELGQSPKMAVEFLNDQTFVTSQGALLQGYHAKRGKIKASGVLERALVQAETSKGVVVSVVIPPEAIQEAAKDVPPQAAVLLKAKEFLGSLDLNDRLVVQASLVMEDAAAATEAKQTADGFIGLARLMLEQSAKDPAMAPFIQTGRQALNDLKIEQQDKEVRLAFHADVTQLAGLLLPAIEKVKAAALTTNAGNNLKEIGLAWFNYMDTYKSFPPQTFGKGLSWRVAILPFIEQNQLYQQFKLDEPWDSEHNRKLIPLMPKTYASANAKAPPGFTFIQTFVGPKTINATPTKGIDIRAIKDGTSNTLILAEAPQAVEWTKPADIAVTPNQPVQLGGTNPQFAQVLFADGSSRQLPRTLDDKTLRLLIDPADGTPVRLP
jgi:hypothetical protein